MNTVPAKEIYKLDGAIVPQLFIERDGDIYFFDKINLHEGRFCRFQRGEVKVVLEVGEGQGIINHRGEIYLLKIGTSTVISKYRLNGQLEKTITLDGIYFDFKINESGYFILLGYVENDTIIKILSSDGFDAGVIKPKKILFGSCIGLYEDDIYLGGFDDKNIFTLISMNYIGSIQNEWRIDINSEDRIIGKIQRYNKHVLLHIVGKYDNLVILNSEDGSIKEIFPQDLGLRSFIDANINEGQIQILDEKCIYTWNLNDLLNISKNTKYRNKVENFSPASYQYLMYMKGLEKEIVNSFKISSLITSIIFIYLFYNEIPMDISIDKVILLGFTIFWILNFTIASTKNLIVFMDKSKRIDELLNIYSLKDEKNELLPLFIGFTAVSFCTIFLYPDFNIFIALSLGVMLSIFTHYLRLKLIKDVIFHNENVSIELLNYEESRFGEYLKTVIETTKNKNCEGVFINLTLRKNIGMEIIDGWIRSRKNILGIEPGVFINENLVMIELDFSKRDIKYSRYSILMDYICYIERETNIEEIQIGPLEDKG